MAAPPKKLILRNWLAVGDIVMMTAAVRDLHKAHPGRYLTDVRTPFPALWRNNPYVTQIADNDPEAELIELHYPAIHQSNQRPRHFVEAMTEYLGDHLGVAIRCTETRGDIHISEEERRWFSRIRELTGADIPYWIVMAGGKMDFPVKWSWGTERWQAVVDHFRGRVIFMQAGEMKRGHVHEPLRGVIDLRGETDLRQMVRLMYFAQGVLTPITAAMHLAAAVPSRWGPERRPCVVVAGGREPIQWVSYPEQQFIHTVGALRCCQRGGCWKARVEPKEPGKPDSGQCVDIADGRPRCMAMIAPAEVIARIERYFEGGVVDYLTADQALILRDSGAVGTVLRGKFDRAAWPLPLRLLAMDARPEDRGLGDIFARHFGAAGETFKAKFKELTGHDCGCDARQDSLNSRYPFKFSAP